MAGPGPKWRGTWMGRRRSANVKCANGHIAGLTHHAIADDGTVTPSLVCASPKCDWHVHAKLIGWSPERAQ